MAELCRGTLTAAPTTLSTSGASWTDVCSSSLPPVDAGIGKKKNKKKEKWKKKLGVFFTRLQLPEHDTDSRHIMLPTANMSVGLHLDGRSRRREAEVGARLQSKVVGNMDFSYSVMVCD